MADLGGVRGPITAAGALPGDGDADVDAEHASEDGGREIRGELEERCRARSSWAEPECTEALREPVGAHVAAGLPAGEQPARGAQITEDGMTSSGRDEAESERVIAKTTGHKGTAMLRRYIREGSLFTQNAAARVGL